MQKNFLIHTKVTPAASTGLFVRSIHHTKRNVSLIVHKKTQITSSMIVDTNKIQ